VATLSVSARAQSLVQPFTVQISLFPRAAARLASMQETVQNLGGYWVAGCGDREFGMKWRVMLELAGADGAVGVHEVGGGAAVAEYTPRMIGLTLAEGKRMLSAVQCHLVGLCG
jgi:hypothetical protein